MLSVGWMAFKSTSWCMGFLGLVKEWLRKLFICCTNDIKTTFFFLFFLIGARKTHIHASYKTWYSNSIFLLHIVKIFRKTVKSLIWTDLKLDWSFIKISSCWYEIRNIDYVHQRLVVTLFMNAMNQLKVFVRKYFRSSYHRCDEARFGTICVRDLVPIVQFKKTWKTPMEHSWWRPLFSKVT